ncbi:TetR/AcrR family transcriptional regulator [Amycolatopsis jiangsuensis]|uniref:AcrR family transcriptional regulator n=1 Tax=Amycolatopsis jiangsuensis TaxID=1181879 RepID=A0A840J4M5_9PSEU|nr:TetR/AcrR family transcriptional regulator C-terminal domain-containing protein [Amycolatopsis jiangsuensis]MBB4688358.1 AcrR family transcriptional regulator [Amycolatopsis jiangsuensis]
MASSGSYNRRERPAKPALSREGIVAAALEVVRHEGVERVTMRRLAKELDTGPASLYVYVSDAEELHAAVLDELLGEVSTVSLPGADWRTRLWTLTSAYRDVLYAHPGLARVALVTRLSGPHYLRIADAVLGLLTEGGVPPGPAAWTVDLLLLVSTATAVEHGTRRNRPGSEAEQDALAQALRSLSPESHPHIAATGAHLLSGSGTDRAQWALDTLLNGARATPLPPGA